MSLLISASLLNEIHKHGETAYPDEGAGFLLGLADGMNKKIQKLLLLTNARQVTERYNRYLLTPENFLSAELQADRENLEILGVFHSHPDHPNQPSAYDLEWALPQMSYMITSVIKGKAVESRSWVLNEDRSKFVSEELLLPNGK